MAGDFGCARAASVRLDSLVRSDSAPLPLAIIDRFLVTLALARPHPGFVDSMAAVARNDSTLKRTMGFIGSPLLRVMYARSLVEEPGLAAEWDRLAEQGVSSQAPVLPSCGETAEQPGAEGPGLAEDVASVRQVLTASDEPTVVVAHSYGGIVTAEAAAGVDAVRHPLLVSSYLPEIGQSLSSFGGEQPAAFLDVDPEGGTFTVRPEALAETFLQDCDPPIQRQAMGKTARQSLAVLEQPVQSAAWQHVPTTYLVCAQDRGTPADLQREFAGRAAGVVELDAGHHPSSPAPPRSAT
jgi:pimeloyl-ACP methyl ester carboxylesterase